MTVLEWTTVLVGLVVITAVALMNGWLDEVVTIGILALLASLVVAGLALIIKELADVDSSGRPEGPPTKATTPVSRDSRPD